MQAGVDNCIWADCFAIGVVARWVTTQCIDDDADHYDGDGDSGQYDGDDNGGHYNDNDGGHYDVWWWWWWKWSL